ncbi:MAG: phosphoribosylamine--glycine ligase [Deltaproteobacteria bacterium]|nr:phosphoribosylamine--glycine ligase [Deltaproteobacteria bacterium]
MAPTVLVVGSGGREHALAHVLQRSASAPRVISAPGNAGTPNNRKVSVTDVDAVVALAEAEGADLVVVGPEAPLVRGLADRLRARGIPVLGPDAAAAELEGSKAFAKAVMDEAGVPTARWGRFTEADAAVAFARTLEAGAVVKADGLAAGKGVVVAEDMAEAEAAIRDILGGAHGEAGRVLVVEERLVGEELSVIALCDGHRIAVLAPSQDHKRVGEGDTGPNTGGMGAYSPAPRGTPQLMAEVHDSCLMPVVEVLRRRGAPFSGVLYAGLMLTADGPRVLEYNVRFGDPETQVILPRLAEDAYELFMACARGALPDRPVAYSPRSALTVVMASEGYPASPRLGDAITGLDDAAALPDVHVFHAGTTLDGDVVRTSGGRVLAVTGLGDDLAAAAKAAYSGVERIAWPGAHYRRDIGFRALKG